MKQKNSDALASLLGIIVMILFWAFCMFAAMALNPDY
jgi:hypothetical protein